MKRSKMLVFCVMMIVPTFLNAGETTSQIIKGKPVLVVMDIQNAYLPYMDEEEVESRLEMITTSSTCSANKGFLLFVFITLMLSVALRLALRL